jgi:hypothetical protein
LEIALHEPLSGIGAAAATIGNYSHDGAAGDPRITSTSCWRAVLWASVRRSR